MRKKLKRIVWWLNFGLECVPIVLVLFTLAISSLVMIVFSPLLAFFSANGWKLAHTTSDSWWGTYKTSLIDFCTEALPIVVYMNNF